MNDESFYDWLTSKKSLSNRAAKDVISRYKRICKILSINEFDDNTLDKLIVSEEFNTLSMFIKSQLKRTVALYSEFGGSDE